jgi:hypothetical protein
MLKIDNSLLEELGLSSLPDAEKNSLLRHIYETLEMRVGMRLADQMTNEQLDEFEKYFEAKDDAGAFKWLETNFPNYKEIVQEEFDKLKAEVGQSAPQILSASQANAQNPQAAMPPPTAASAAQQPYAQPYQQPQPMPSGPGPAPVNPQPSVDQPMQGPNSQQPVQPFDPGVAPQVAPAPAQPYAAPPEPPRPPMPPVPPSGQPQTPPGQPFSPPPNNWQPPQTPPASDTPQQ